MREYNISELKNLIREAYLDLLTENAESSNRSKARQLLRDKNYVTRDNFKAGDEEERIVINTLPSVRYNNFKFAIFFYSLYYQYKDDVKVEVKNADEQNNEEYNEWKIINTYFFNILKEEGDNFDYTKYLINKNDYTLIPLKELLKIIEEYNSNREEDNQDYNTSEYPYNGYKIIKITSFTQSKEYSKYCSWCVTNSKKLYNDYTDDGFYCFHYCLRYDYKDTNEPLSMLAVLVDDYGDLKQVTTRANNGDHYYETEKEVEQHFGIDNFSSVFKPITEEELEQVQEEEQRIKEDYQKNIKQYLKQGHNIEDILKKAYDEFEYVEDLDLFKVYDNGEYNYIDKQGNLLSNEWFDDIEYEEETDLFRVRNFDEYNYIDKKGNLISNKWYYDIQYNNRIGLFWVDNNNTENYIDREGNFLFNKWYDKIKYTDELDLFWINDNEKYNYIDKQGNLLFNEWYVWLLYDERLDLFKVRNLNYEENYIDREGNLIFKEWCVWLLYDEDINLFKIRKDSKLNYIDIKGVLLFNEWYDNIKYDKHLNLFWATKDDKEYYIDINENIIKKVVT